MQDTARRVSLIIISLNCVQYQQWLSSRCVTWGVVTPRDSVTCDMSQCDGGGRWRHWHCWQWACWANQDGINKQLEHVLMIKMLWCSVFMISAAGIQLTAHSAPQLSSRAEIFSSCDLSFCRQNGGSLWGSTYKIVWTKPWVWSHPCTCPRPQ